MFNEIVPDTSGLFQFQFIISNPRTSNLSADDYNDKDITDSVIYFKEFCTSELSEKTQFFGGYHLRVLTKDKFIASILETKHFVLKVKMIQQNEVIKEYLLTMFHTLDETPNNDKDVLMFSFLMIDVLSRRLMEENHLSFLFGNEDLESGSSNVRNNIEAINFLRINIGGFIRNFYGTGVNFEIDVPQKLINKTNVTNLVLSSKYSNLENLVYFIHKYRFSVGEQLFAFTSIGRKNPYMYFGDLLFGTRPSKQDSITYLSSIESFGFLDTLTYKHDYLDSTKVLKNSKGTVVFRNENVLSEFICNQSGSYELKPKQSGYYKYFDFEMDKDHFSKYIKYRKNIASNVFEYKILEFKVNNYFLLSIGDFIEHDGVKYKVIALDIEFERNGPNGDPNGIIENKDPRKFWYMNVQAKTIIYDKNITPDNII